MNCNNPLNIRLSPHITWKGQCKSQTDGRFVQFELLEWGFRAAFCILHTYAIKYKATCIAEIVRRWAPPSENNTSHYIRCVCLWTGFGGQQRLTEADWPRLLQAMARMETGEIYDLALIERGYRLYKKPQAL